MKSLSLFLCLLVLPFFVSAQDLGKDAVVAASNLNILYLGVSNPVEIAVPGFTSDKVTATITNGTISKSDNGWEVKPSSLSDVIITVLANNKKVSEKKFRVREIPAPVAVFMGKVNGKVSKNEVLKAEVLKAELKDFLWDLTFEIKSFTLAYSKDGMDYEISSKSNTMTDEMKSVIADLQRGQYITFKDIKALGPDKRIRDLNPLIISVD